MSDPALNNAQATAQAAMNFRRSFAHAGNGNAAKGYPPAAGPHIVSETPDAPCNMGKTGKSLKSGLGGFDISCINVRVLQIQCINFFEKISELSGSIFWIHEKLNKQDILNHFIEGSSIAIQTRIPEASIDGFLQSNYKKPAGERIPLILRFNHLVTNPDSRPYDLRCIDPRPAEAIPEHPAFGDACHAATLAACMGR